MAKLTLLDIAKLSGNDAIVGLIEENLDSAPELRVMDARTIRGTTYKAGIRTGLPTSQFREANKGVATSRSTFRQLLVEAFVASTELEVDVAVATAHEDGAAALLAIEASGGTESIFRRIASQMYYGTSADARGFSGLKAATPFGGTTSTAGGAKANALTINAGGSTASTASSVYLVRYGVQDVQLVLGNQTTLTMDEEWRKQQVADAEGNKFTAFVNSLTAWVGLQIGNEHAVRRIANLTADSGKGLTDSLLAEALATFPVGKMPTHILMSRRSRMQLQKSRTVVLQGQGNNRPNQPAIAPEPTEYSGIPIIVTDAILDTDAIES